MQKKRKRCNDCCFVDRRLLVAFNAKTKAADADGSAEYHIPHVHVSTGLRRVVLLEWRHVFHRENCRLPSVQLSVSMKLYPSRNYAPSNNANCRLADRQ